MSKNISEQSGAWRFFANRLSHFCKRFSTLAKTEKSLEYVLILFFWKYISDWWKEEIESSLHVGEQAEVRLKLANSRFFVLPGASFYDVVSRCGEPEIGSYINQALGKISVANSPLLEGIFEQIDFTSEQEIGPKDLRTSILSEVLNGLNDKNLDMSPSKVTDLDFGELIVFILSKHANLGRNVNQSYIDDDIAKLIANLSQPEAGNLICDPVCETGSLLIRVSEEVGRGECQLFGQEKEASVQAIARANMIFHGIDDAKIYIGDSFRPFVLDDGEKLKQFDRVVANLPMHGLQLGLSTETNDKLFDRESISPWGNFRAGGNHYLAFLDLMVNLTRPIVGKLVVALPESCLVKAKEELMFRRLLVKENILDAVICLPKNEATQGASIILVIDRSRESGGKNSARNNVMFIDTKDYFKSDKEASSGDSGLNQLIMKSYHTRVSEQNFSYNSSIDEIELNNFDLTVARYVHSAQSNLHKLIDDDQISIDLLKKELAKLDTKISENMRLLLANDSDE